MALLRGNKKTTTGGDSPFFYDDHVPAPGQSGAQPAPGAPGDDLGMRGKSGGTSAEGTLFAAPGAEDIGPDYTRPHGFRRGRDEISVYNDQMSARYAMDPRLLKTIILLVVAVALIPVALVLPTHLLTQNSTIALASESLLGRINALGQITSDTAAGQSVRLYFWQVLAVAIAGAGLALNGAVYQGTLRNALASPSTLGVMSGATLGNVFYLLFFIMPETGAEAQLTFTRASEITAKIDSMDLPTFLLASQMRVLCCLAGCLVVVLLVLAVAFIAGRGRVSKVGLLVSGQVFTAVIASAIEMIRYYIRDFGDEAQLAMLRSMVTGSFADIYSGLQVILLGIPVLLGIVAIMAMRNRLNLLAFDDEQAKSMGISVTFARTGVIAICTVLTAVIVAFVGAVGFVGFLVPHVARKMVGPDFRYYIPASICLGMVYLLVAYSLMSVFDIFTGSIGTFTSIIGAVFFVVAAVRQRARGNVDWI